MRVYSIWAALPEQETWRGMAIEKKAGGRASWVFCGSAALASAVLLGPWGSLAPSALEAWPRLRRHGSKIVKLGPKPAERNSQPLLPLSVVGGSSSNDPHLAGNQNKRRGGVLVSSGQR